MSFRNPDRLKKKKTASKITPKTTSETKLIIVKKPKNK